MSKLFILLLVVVICSMLLANYQVSGTSSQCRGPSSSTTGGKRGATTLETELDEMIEAELLNAHITLSEQGLDHEDLEYFTQLTEEHMQNTLLFRRLFRRIGRAIRRIGRAIGRVFRAIGGIFRRRRAREIIMNSVKNFNGFTGPNRDSLESRRPFIGGGAQNTNTVSASVASTLGFFRRRHRRHRAVVSPISGRPSIINSIRPTSAVVSRRSRRSRRPSIFSRIGERIKSGVRRITRRVRGAISKVKGSLKSKMEALEKSTSGTASNHPVNCVACRVDCLKSYETIGGAMFTGCGQRYYYYGCQAVSPCLQTMTSSDDEIEGMIGICAYRNDCKFKNEWAAVSDNQLLADRLVGRIRGSKQNPE